MRVGNEQRAAAGTPVDTPMASLPWQPDSWRVGDDVWLGSPDAPAIVRGQVARLDAERVSVSACTARPLAVGSYVVIDAQYVAEVIGSSKVKVQLVVLPPEGGQAVLAAWWLAQREATAEAGSVAE